MVMRWDLETIFAGGADGPAFRDALAAARAAIEQLAATIAALPKLVDDRGAWTAAVAEEWRTHDLVHELSSFAACWQAVDAHGAGPRRANAAVTDVMAEHEQAVLALRAGMDEADPAAVDAWLADPAAAEIAPYLAHVRSGAPLRLPRGEQAVATALSREALHGWGDLYDLVSGGLTATVEGEAAPISIAELAPRLADPDEAVRRRAHTAAAAAWHGAQDLCASALNHLIGARQTLDDRLGVDELASTLHRNRLSRGSLDAMWAAVDEVLPSLVRYLDRKARLLGKDKLDWWDLSAPLPSPDESLSWETATAHIARAFGRFSPALEGFAVDALAAAWVDAEPRAGRRQGGFCARFPGAQESRIFMTWGDNHRTATTLAHELGHAYHNHWLLTLPASRRRVVSATAETASTFAEALFRDAALDAATDPAARVAMLDQELIAAVSFLMNIRARFEFERELYRMRRQGALEAEALCEAMAASQERAYCGALATYDETFWASKLHFYISYFGFYNWPYTFGYLFSGAVYARATAEGPSFEAAYNELLKCTGYLTSEAAARRTLGADLGDVGFWRGALAPVVARVDAFLEATA